MEVPVPDDRLDQAQWSVPKRNQPTPKPGTGVSPRTPSYPPHPAQHDNTVPPVPNMPFTYRQWRPHSVPILKIPNATTLQSHHTPPSTVILSEVEESLLVDVANSQRGS